jgi:hypothetical protein
LLPPNATAIRGKEAIREWLQTFPPVRDFTLRVDEIDGLDDQAEHALEWRLEYLFDI